MKLLVVAQREDLKNLIAYHLKPLGFEIVYYSDPVKLIDNVDELDPDMILFNAVDFPRHWIIFAWPSIQLFRALFKSSIKSATSSIPTARRKSVSVIPSL